MNLGELQLKFQKLKNREFVFTKGFSDPHSYRGYYNQVCFEPTTGVPLKEILESINDALTQTFVAYKGGEYTYGIFTTTNLQMYGHCENNDCQKLEELVKEMIEEYKMSENTKKRKTKADREEEARVATEERNTKRWEAFKESYTTDLLDLVYDYSNIVERDEMKVVRSSEGYTFHNFNQSWEKAQTVPHPSALPETYNREVEYRMGVVKGWIDDARIEAAEKERLDKLCKTALSKLTDEEKSALGI